MLRPAAHGIWLPDTYRLVADRVDKIPSMPDVHSYALKELWPQAKTVSQ